MIRILTELFQSGGSVMVPLALVSLLMGYMIMERFLALRSERLFMDIRAHSALEKYFQGDHACLEAMCAGPECAARRMLSAVRDSRARGRPALRRALAEIEKVEIPRFYRGLNMIAVLAALAPLLGLLGTVSGMIFAFDVISLHGTGDPHALSGGIGRALISTQTGLLVALPGIFAHNWLTDRADRLVDELRRMAMLVARRTKGAGNGSH